MKNLITALYLILFAISIQAQRSLPYHSGFDNVSEKVGWKEYRLGPTTDNFRTWDYSRGDEKSPPECLIHYYPVGGMETTNDWFVSPALDFSTGAIIDSVWHYFRGPGTPWRNDTIALYYLIGDQHPDSASTKELLILYTDSTYQSDNTWRYRSGIEIPASSEDGFIAFRYQTIANWLDAQFDDIYISPSTSNTRYNSELNGKITIAPNPVTDHVKINLEAGLQMNKLKLIDNTGRVIKSFSNPEQLLDVSTLPKGLYYLDIETSKGMALKRVIKQ